MIFLFGLDDTGKKLKKALSMTGADMSQVRPWLKSYMYVRKNARPVAEHYRRTRSAAEAIQAEAAELEEMLIGYADLTDQQSSRLKEIIEKLKSQKEDLDFEFVIGMDDKDVHLTVESVIRLSTEYPEKKADPVILQSEVENLSALIKDRLNKEGPDLFLLACYYRNHTDQELQDKSHTSRLIYVDDIFHEEFAGPILPILKQAREKAAAWKENAAQNPEKYRTGKNKKLLETTAILLDDDESKQNTAFEPERQSAMDFEADRTPEEERFLRKLCFM